MLLIKSIKWFCPPLYRNNPSVVNKKSGNDHYEIVAAPCCFCFKNFEIRYSLQGKISGFQLVLDEREEAFGIRAVDHAMIETQREIGHPPNADEVVAVGRSHDLGPFFDLADAQNSELGLVDDRSAE